MNTLTELLKSGQSYWLDNLTRKKITSGELKKRVAEKSLRGITSNPSIFNKAISESNDYDEQIFSLVNEGKSAHQIYDALTVKDVQDACDILKPVYDQSAGTDGFVSLEVPPYLARDTQNTIKEARRLFAMVGRINCFIKIPGTREGIPAIEQMLYEGVNINITLLFSVERYAEIAQTYFQAIERRVTENKPVDTVVSVASIFISRIDVLVDQLLGQHIIPFEGNTDTGQNQLLGKAGIATARLSYQKFKEIFSTNVWKNLKSNGAQIQRPLWASTSNKDPLYDELRYVEALIGSDTINTLPDETIKTFEDRGKLSKNSIEDKLDQAEQLFWDLKKTGIDMDFVTQQLENEGIQKFTDAYKKLIGNLADKRLKVLEDKISTQNINYGILETKINAAFSSLDEKRIEKLLFDKDPYLWKKDPEQTQKISQRLDWLSLPDSFQENIKNITGFASKAVDEGYSDAVLLGMGGSSLCSEVALQTFGTINGYLKLHVLDNTDPVAIIELKNKINLDKTLFIVASKSGKTEETLGFFHYFYHQVKMKNKNNPGNNFIAITDNNTPLVKTAEQYKFRKVFFNPPNLGGRYSVLSYFGLVPMALIGADINSFLFNAQQMKISCVDIPSENNPGVSLGVVLGICQKKGRDKATFILSSSISSFGYWIEQLLAESTGKEGKGLIPIIGETLGNPNVYGNDRIFIHIHLSSDNNEEDEKKIQAIEEEGHPVIRIKVPNKTALAGEYYKWEIATAIAGMVIGINPFDQPNVEESKKNTRQLLSEWSENGSFKKGIPLFNKDDVALFSGKRTEHLVAGHSEFIGEMVNSFIGEAKQNDYIALLPYFQMTDKRIKKFQTWRQQIQNELKIATTLLNGPRYLHSTGQLHKGGPDTGLYIIMIGNEEKELAIPEKKFGFATLHQAQALGDFRSLDDKGRRVILIQLKKNIDQGLDELIQPVKKEKKRHLQQEAK